MDLFITELGFENTEGYEILINMAIHFQGHIVLHTPHTPVGMFSFDDDVFNCAPTVAGWCLQF